MKYMNLLALFTRPSIFAAAMSVAVMFAFVSSASAGEKNFDALGDVTAEALTPADMDEIRGTGSIHVHYKNGFHVFVAGRELPNAPWNIVVNLSVKGPGTVTWVGPK